MEKVFVIGAHGHVGQQLVTELTNAGIETYAGLRDLEQASDLQKSDLVKPTQFDLNELPDEMSSQLKASGADAVVFSAGSGGNTGDDATLMIDLDGAVKAMEAAKDAGIKRFIMISAAASDNRKLWDRSGLKPYMIAKHYADQILAHSGLDYTILRPGSLTNDDQTGRIKLVGDSDAEVANLSVARADVAAVIKTILDNPATYQKIYTFGSGASEIETAFD